MPAAYPEKPPIFTVNILKADSKKVESHQHKEDLMDVDEAAEDELKVFDDETEVAPIVLAIE